MGGTRSADLDLADLNVAQEVVAYHEVLSNRLADIGERFRFGLTLRPATREAWDGHAVAFIGVPERDLVLHRGVLRFLKPSSRYSARAPQIVQWPFRSPAAARPCDTIRVPRTRGPAAASLARPSPTSRR